MLVEVRFDDLVEHAARTTGQGNAEQSGESGLPVDQGVGGEYFADGGGEDQQGDDPGFGQDPEVMEKEAGAKILGGGRLLFLRPTEGRRGRWG
ncbi:hypothetical protein [Acidithiobacillus thiooxidans]|uniref:hypothetical protein n=1 Tax=Acidithiobacillus thiooxidans TaxID=930 RepID=UPI001F1E2B26|nr:hypothetical protein [Acidithiobacillus thiooxidans]